MRIIEGRVIDPPLYISLPTSGEYSLKLLKCHLIHNRCLEFSLAELNIVSSTEFLSFIPLTESVVWISIKRWTFSEWEFPFGFLKLMISTCHEDFNARLIFPDRVIQFSSDFLPLSCAASIMFNDPINFLNYNEFYFSMLIRDGWKSFNAEQLICTNDKMSVLFVQDHPFCSLKPIYSTDYPFRVIFCDCLGEELIIGLQAPLEVQFLHFDQHYELVNSHKISSDISFTEGFRLDKENILLHSNDTQYLFSLIDDKFVSVSSKIQYFREHLIKDMGALLINDITHCYLNVGMHPIVELCQGFERLFHVVSTDKLSLYTDSNRFYCFSGSFLSESHYRRILSSLRQFTEDNLWNHFLLCLFSTLGSFWERFQTAFKTFFAQNGSAYKGLILLFEDRKWKSLCDNSVFSHEYRTLLSCLMDIGSNHLQDAEVIHYFERQMYLMADQKPSLTISSYEFVYYMLNQKDLPSYFKIFPTLVNLYTNRGRTKDTPLSITLCQLQRVVSNQQTFITNYEFSDNRIDQISSILLSPFSIQSILRDTNLSRYIHDMEEYLLDKEELLLAEQSRLVNAFSLHVLGNLFAAPTHFIQGRLENGLLMLPILSLKYRFSTHTSPFNVPGYYQTISSIYPDFINSMTFSSAYGITDHSGALLRSCQQQIILQVPYFWYGFSLSVDEIQSVSEFLSKQWTKASNPESHRQRVEAISEAQIEPTHDSMNFAQLAGLILKLGFEGKLKQLPYLFIMEVLMSHSNSRNPKSVHQDRLIVPNSMLAVSLLLGLSISWIGEENDIVTKLLQLHCPSVIFRAENHQFVNLQFFPTEQNPLLYFHDLNDPLKKQIVSKIEAEIKGQSMDHSGLISGISLPHYTTTLASLLGLGFLYFGKHSSKIASIFWAEFDGILGHLEHSAHRSEDMISESDENHSLLGNSFFAASQDSSSETIFKPRASPPFQLDRFVKSGLKWAWANSIPIKRCSNATKMFPYYSTLSNPTETIISQSTSELYNVVASSGSLKVTCFSNTILLAHVTTSLIGLGLLHSGHDHSEKHKAGAKLLDHFKAILLPSMQIPSTVAISHVGVILSLILIFGFKENPRLVHQFKKALLQHSFPRMDHVFYMTFSVLGFSQSPLFTSKIQVLDWIQSQLSPVDLSYLSTHLGLFSTGSFKGFYSSGGSLDSQFENFHFIKAMTVLSAIIYYLGIYASGTRWTFLYEALISLWNHILAVLSHNVDLDSAGDSIFVDSYLFKLRLDYLQQLDLVTCRSLCWIMSGSGDLFLTKTIRKLILLPMMPRSAETPLVFEPLSCRDASQCAHLRLSLGFLYLDSCQSRLLGAHLSDSRWIFIFLSFLPFVNDKFFHHEILASHNDLHCPIFLQLYSLLSEEPDIRSTPILQSPPHIPLSILSLSEDLMLPNSQMLFMLQALWKKAVEKLPDSEKKSTETTLSSLVDQVSLEEDWKVKTQKEILLEFVKRQCHIYDTNCTFTEYPQSETFFNSEEYVSWEQLLNLYRRLI